mgnify:CR=1 FL=1
MKFVKIRLLGFKSFVDPVEISILPGLTGIVGPNGCGKSNLLEAMRWVMGENRPTSIRGGGMEDVIFAGTGARPARNYAEVTLTLEHSDSVNPSDFAKTNDVEIVRRVTKDIGSIFKINGKDARSRDIQMFFADASTGAHSPSLVKQGQISELINANPKSRRGLLEDAAGISGLYQRRHEAELKLTSTESNLSRVQDVLEQLEGQLRSLERQARQASKYKEISSQLRDFESLLIIKKWREANEKFLGASSALTEVSKKLAISQKEIVVCLKNKEMNEAKLPELRDNQNKSASALQRFIIEKENIKTREDSARELLSDFEVRLQQFSEDLEREDNLINDAKTTFDRLKVEEHQLEKLSFGNSEKLRISHEAAEKSFQDLGALELKLDLLSEKVASLTAENHASENRLTKARDDLHTLNEDSLSIETELQALLSERIKEEQKVSALSEGKLISEGKLDEAEETLNRVELELVAALEEESKFRNQFAAKEAELGALKSEESAILELINSSKEIENPVLEKVIVEKGYEKAIGVAMANEFLFPIITENVGTGWFEMPRTDELYKLPDDCNPIMNKITAPSAVSRALSSIGVVDKCRGQALQKSLKPGQKIVSMEGDLWRWDGYCISAEERPSDSTLRLRRDNRLREIKTLIFNAEDSTRRLEDQFKKAKELSSIKREQISDAREKRKDSDDELSRVISDLSKAESSCEICESKINNLRNTIQSKSLDKKTFEKEIRMLEGNDVYQINLNKEKEKLDEHKILVEESRKKMLEKRTVYEELKRKVESRGKRLEQVSLELENWHDRMHSAKNRKREIALRQEEFSKKLKEAEGLPTFLKEKRNELTELLKSAELSKASATDQLLKQEAIFKKFLEEEKILQTRVSELREQVARADAIKETARESMENFKKSIDGEFGEDPDQLAKKLKIDDHNILSVPSIEEKIHFLRSKRESMGAVNLLAEKDSSVLAKEYEILLEEKEDLEGAVKKLRTGITKLNTDGRSRLLSAFEKVNENFNNLFVHLFGGGTANLALIENEDPLDAGLEIMCQPPGKKLSTLSLLSGGEQTLTAISLIFAVFLVNPSPICVLDEVDAPLDDANVQRFCSLLDKMTANTDTRFMIITHHALTMSRMDRLYGVTMVERGVSQLVSVDLQKAEKMIEA